MTTKKWRKMWRRKQGKKIKPWRPRRIPLLSSEDYAASQRPVTPFRKPALADRLPSAGYLIRQLRAEERARMQREHPREIDEFKAGDYIAVTKYLQLGRPKFEVLEGWCLGRFKGEDNLDATFILRGIKLNVGYEMNIPLWSPFIAKVRNKNAALFYLLVLSPLCLCLWKWKRFLYPRVSFSLVCLFVCLYCCLWDGMHT
jgi:ribosomal protein L19